MRRRKFLGYGLASATGLMGGRFAIASKPDPPIDALVIGGGLAGLAFAQRPLAAGPRGVVLEARQRNGGRIRT